MLGSVSVSITAKANVSIPLADEGQSELGTVATISKCNVIPNTLVATGNLGTVIPKGVNNISVLGQVGTISLGIITIDAEANQTLSGQSATSSLGTIVQDHLIIYLSQEFLLQDL